MKKPTFYEGVAVAFIASLGSSIVYTVLMPLFQYDWVSRLLIAGGSLAYIIYLMARSRERIGRITTGAIWFSIAVITWWLQLPLELFALLHLGLIWLIRSLYFYSGLFSSLLDFGLTALSLAAAVWAAVHTGSIFLSVWCFFLCQALFVIIPPTLNRHARQKPDIAYRNDGFQCAYQTAEAAIRKLSSVGK